MNDISNPLRTATQRVRAGLVASIVLLLLAPACAEPRPQNLLLVTIDTLRADHTGPGGYARETTPNLDRFAAQSVVFERAAAASSWTLPSLVTLMTSLHSSTHRSWSYASRLGAQYDTLPEILSESGYETAIVTNHLILGPRFGLQQGFTNVDDDLISDTPAAVDRTISSPEITQRSLGWLGERDPANGPFFLWVHYFDPHDEYLLHDGVSERFGTYAPIDRYDGEISFTDTAIGELLEGLDAMSLAEDTIVVVTADHGEEFGEHGGFEHGHTLYQELLHVPLIIRAPGFEPRRVGQRVGLIDVMPTLLDLLGLGPQSPVDGLTLVPSMRGEPQPDLESRPMLFELRLFKNGMADSVIDGDLKLIADKFGKRIRLFDLSADPEERHDIAEQRPQDKARLFRALMAMKKDARRKAKGFAPPVPVELSEQDKDQLRLLGYLHDDEPELRGVDQ